MRERRLLSLLEEWVHGGLQFTKIHLALEEPLLQRLKGGIGEQFGHAGNGERGAGGARAAEAGGVVVPVDPQGLASVCDEAINERG